MIEIAAVHAREVFDSRGRPTVEADVRCRGGALGRAMVPSGASTGRHEALELRDRGSPRLGGMGVREAVRNVVETIGPALRGMDVSDQRAIDAKLIELDGTADKSRLGANAILGVSLAVAHASAAAMGEPLVQGLHRFWRTFAPASGGSTQATAGLGERMRLPMPMVNMISGGRHAGGNLRIQDFLIIPVGAATYRDAFDAIVETYFAVSSELTSAGFEGVLVGDEGGYGPKLPSHEQALDIVMQGIARTSRRPGRDVAIALDVASTQFFRDGRYRLGEGQHSDLSAAELVDVLDDWTRRYPIVSLEDPLHEDDWEGWRLATERFGDRLQLIGDDLFVTNPRRLRMGMDRGVANSVLIKLNQIGTLTETLETMRLALDAGYRPVVSARSGETEDTTIADLAVATGAGQIKIGSVARSERLAKYNQLLRLEELLGDEAPFATGLLAAD
ncbi:MAG: phosphopyruvate hydratase [Planctomyces sp.]|nr:phosphopyruvate hydratase [Planctomyces sp.]